MLDWLAKISAFFVALVKDVFLALITWLHDGALWVFDGVLQAIAAVVAAIPAPAFLTTVSIGGLFSEVPPFALFLLGKAQFGTALAMIGAAVGFRLLRKLLTLGQW